ARAGVVSCGGCHKFSANRPIAPNVPWPSDQGFVHVTEEGTLSAALNEHLLPARRENLMQGTPAPAAPPVANLNPVDARSALGKVGTSQTRAQALEALRDFEVRVQTLREVERQQPGLFVPNRRVH